MNGYCLSTNPTARFLKSFKPVSTLFSSMASQRLISVDYEVHGKVQGVFFRKYTQEEAKKLNLVGWVQNTPQGTVVGTVQGPEDKIRLMKNWLSKVGSKKSRIDKCDFKNEKTLESLGFTSFDIDRSGESAKPKKTKPRKK